MFRRRGVWSRRRLRVDPNAEQVASSLPSETRPKYRSGVQSPDATRHLGIMPMRFTCLLLALSTCLGCGNSDSKPRGDASMPPGADVGVSDADATVSPGNDAAADAALDPTNLTATWRGDFTAAVAPGNTYWIEVALTHDGAAIGGTFTSENGRLGTISGTIEGATITSEMVFTDGCAGTATSRMELAADGSRIVGTYLSTDCHGERPGAVDGAYDGTMDLVRQP